jgi:exopolysaccharide/PEP-CTERM locus tyrosine autokinase
LGFIDKALEKAKALKQQSPEIQAPSPPRAAPPEVPPSVSGADIPVREIHYTCTRTVPVQAETLQRHRIVAGDENDLVREELKILRTQILQRTKADKRNTLMITGPLPGDGKTLTAINLAISMAQEVDKTVLLVDADLRHPSVHDYFGIPRGPGLTDYLLGGMSIPQLLVHPEGFDKLVILPGGRPVDGAAELVGSPMMADLTRELKHYYPDRYVLFDLPPLLSYADPLAFAPLVDGIILVVEMGKTPREDILKCVELLQNYPILGFVLNKVEITNHGYQFYQRNDKPKRAKGLLRWIKS